MAEYIEREKVYDIFSIKQQALLKYHRYYQLSDADKEEFALYDSYMDEVESIPAADVVEVVRCKDCKFAFPHNNYYYCENEDSPFTNSDWAVCPNGDDFCSYGERRLENEQGD